MMRSGRSMVLAMVRTTRRASLWVGQSKRLYITSCFWVHRRSSCQETERDTGSTTENEPGPQGEAGYRCFSSMCPQVTPPEQQGCRWTHAPPPTRECAQVKEKGARTSLLPCICSQTSVQSHCGPPVGAFSPHPQAARWSPERTLESGIA